MKKVFTNKPKVGSIVRGLTTFDMIGFNKLGRVTSIEEDECVIWWQPFHRCVIWWQPFHRDVRLDYSLDKQDITWELVLE